MASFLYHFVGEFFDLASVQMGSMFQNTLSQLANWMSVTSGTRVPNAVDMHASSMQLRIAAAQVVVLMIDKNLQEPETVLGGPELPQKGETPQDIV